MINFYITCFVIAMFVLASGIVCSHLEGVKKAKTPVTETPRANNPLYLDEQHQMATETEQERQRMMDDMKFQIDRQMQRNNPASRGF